MSLNSTLPEKEKIIVNSYDNSVASTSKSRLNLAIPTKCLVSRDCGKAIRSSKLLDKNRDDKPNEGIKGAV